MSREHLAAIVFLGFSFALIFGFCSLFTFSDALRVGFTRFFRPSVNTLHIGAGTLSWAEHTAPGSFGASFDGCSSQSATASSTDGCTDGCIVSDGVGGTDGCIVEDGAGSGTDGTDGCIVPDGVGFTDDSTVAESPVVADSSSFA